VDADVIEKLILKDETTESQMTDKQKEDLRPVFEGQLPEKERYFITYENLSETENPIIITQPEYMRRMKAMSEMSAGMNFYTGLPESYNMVINTNHPLVLKVNEAREKSTGKKVSEIESQFQPVEVEIKQLEDKKKDKKDEEIPTEDKDKLESLRKQLDELKNQKTEVLKEFGKKNKIVRQLIDLALLSNNMLKGAELIRFVNRSIDLIK
jgi:molecular chaperone HtpG